MAKSLLKFVLLVGLSAGASGLPNFLGGLSKLPSGQAPDFAMPAGKDESSAELRREMADLGSTMADLKQLAAGGAPVRAVAGLSGEERDLMRDAAPQLKFRSNALTRQVGLAGGRGNAAAALPQLPGAAGKVLGSLRNSGPEFQSFSDFRRDILRLYHGHQTAITYALWLIPAAAVGLAFLLLLCKRYTLSMLLTGMLFSICSALLWMLSASIALSGVLTKTSLLGVLPRELWLSPVVFLAASAGMLRLSDDNYPIWNRTVSTLLAPIGASLLAAFWPAGVSYVKSLAAGAAAGNS